MILFRLYFFILYFVFSEGNSIYSELSSDLQRINAPEDLGRYLQDQLARNESRSLSRQCFQHLKEYAQGLLTFRLWAITSKCILFCLENILNQNNSINENVKIIILQ